MKKRILSLLLILCMTVSLLPTAAFAADPTENEASIGTQGYATLAEAVSGAEDGDTVKLLKNVDLNNTVTIKKSITIDGAGYSITSSGEPKTMFQIQGGERKLNPVTIKNCKFVTPNASANNETWVAIYVQNTVKNLTIKGNTFEIKALNTEYNMFQCIGLAGDTSDNEGKGGRYTGNIEITGNEVNDMHTESGNAFFVVAAVGRTGKWNETYSTVNLSITDNKLTGNSSNKKLVGASVANASNLTMTGNTFLYCYAGLYLLTGTNKEEQITKANDLTDILTGNDDRGTSEYVLAFAGTTPLVKDETTPMKLYDVAYGRVGLDEDAETMLSKIGFNTNGGRFKYVMVDHDGDGEEDDMRPITDITYVAFPGQTITLPGIPIHPNGLEFDGWKAVVAEGQDSVKPLDKNAGGYAVETQSVQFVAQWKDTEQNAYAYFRPVDSKGNAIDRLNDAVLNRLHLTYNSNAHDWFTYGSLKVATDNLEAAVAKVKAGGEYFTRHDANKDFEYGDQIKWTELIEVDSGFHYGYENRNAAYHLNGDLTFYSVTFEANAPEGATVTGMPDNDYYCEGESLASINSPSCEGYRFVGWTFSGDTFTGAVKSDLTITAKWKKLNPIETRIPVYTFFRAVNSAGENISLDEDLARLGLTYNDSSNVWFTLGKLLTTQQIFEASYAKNSDEFNAVVGELETTNFTRLDTNVDFEGMNSIKWQELKKVNCEHLGYGVTDEAYHLDGTLTFYSINFNANTEDAVYNMPESGMYYEGEALPNGVMPTRPGYFFAGWYDDKNCTKAHDFGDGTNPTDGTATEDVTVYAKWTQGGGEPVNVQVTLTIKCVTGTGKVLDTGVYFFNDPFAEYSIEAPKIKGYTTKIRKVEGTMPGSDYTETIVYRKTSSDGGVTITESPNKIKPKAPKLALNTADHFAYVDGYPDGTVKPEGDVTRAETAAILYRIMDDECRAYYETSTSTYADVSRSDWFSTYVATLEKAGVIADTRTNGKFRPNDAITRAELASMIAQFADLESASAAKFNDVGSRYWAADEIAIAAEMGWINGYPDGSFRPDQNVTRAELMAMVNRALGRTPKSEDDLLSGMKTWRDNANVNAWYYLDVQEATNDHTYTKSGDHETWKKLL